MNVYIPELVENDVKVEWYEGAEGLNGDFDPQDPNDVELLRFYVSKWDGSQWESVESFCTLVPVSTPAEIQTKLLRLIMDTVGDDVRAGISIQRKCEALSWLSNESVDGEP